MLQSLFRAAYGAQLTSASIAASSQDLNGPLPAGTWTETLYQGSPCASDPVQSCEHSRSWMTAITAHGTPVLTETAWYLALAFGPTKRRATDVKFRISLALAQRCAFAAVRALISTIYCSLCGCGGSEASC